jgi:hypothetical protein
MKRVIIDYKKLNPEILSLLTQKFPDGYGDNDVIVFDNHRNETIEAVEVKTDDTIYMVKINSKLHYTLSNFDNSLENADVKDLDLSKEETND